MKKQFKILRGKYKEIENFYFPEPVRHYVQDTKYITKEWINKEVDIKKMENLFSDALSKNEGNIILDGFIIDYNEKKTGHYRQIDLLNSNLRDFDVCKKNNDIIQLSIEWEFEAVFEAEIQKFTDCDSARCEYRYFMNSRTGESDVDILFVPSSCEEYDYKYDNFLFKVYYIIIIVNEKIMNHRLIGWQWL